MTLDTVPQRISVRLDEETRTQLRAYMLQNQMTVSQSIRVLLALSLRDENVSPEGAFRAAAFREGLILGVSKIREKLTRATQDAVASALGELGDIE